MPKNEVDCNICAKKSSQPWSPVSPALKGFRSLRLHVHSSKNVKYFDAPARTIAH